MKTKANLIDISSTSGSRLNGVDCLMSSGDGAKTGFSHIVYSLFTGSLSGVHALTTGLLYF